MKKSERLRKLLHYWELRESAKRAQVAREIRSLEEAREARGVVTESLRDLLDGRSSGRRDLAWVPFESGATESLVMELEAVDERVSEAERKLSERQEELRSVSGRREGMEKLTEGRRREERRESEKSEQKRAEELFRAFRSRR